LKSESEESYVSHTLEEKKPPQFQYQQEHGNLNRDLGLTKSNVEFLTPNLMEWNFSDIIFAELQLPEKDMKAS